MKQGISKDQSKQLQGLAILMMLYHHLFSTPQALGIPYKSLLFINNINFELKLAWFFKICVGIYAFVSGYGLCRSLLINDFKNRICESSFLNAIVKEYKFILKKLKSFYMQYFLVFIVFVPIGFIFFNKGFILSEFLLNLIGIKSTYNGAWWYVLQYVKMLLLLPIIHMFFIIFNKPSQNRIKVILYSCLMIVFLFLFFGFKNIFWNILNFFQISFLLCFIVGYLIARLQIIEYVYKILGDKIPYVLGFIIFVLVIFIRMKIAKDASSAGLDFIFAPALAYGFLCIIHIFKHVGKLFSFLGKYSTYMWLVHVFFYDHYAKRFIMLTGFSTTIYLTLVLVSLISAIILDTIFNRIILYIKR